MKEEIKGKGEKKRSCYREKKNKLLGFFLTLKSLGLGPKEK